MSKRPCNKLVRDNIPSIIDSQKGRKANWRILDNEQYLQELNKKLIEEANEFIEANDIEELADLIEVVESIMKVKEFEWEEVKKQQDIKREKNGGFEDRIYLDFIEEEA